MPSHRKFTRRFWPNTLSWRLLLPVIVTLVMAGAYIWTTIESVAQERHDEVVNTVRHASETFQGFPPKERFTEQFLLTATTAPIQQMAIVESSGRTVLSSLRPENGSAYLREDALKFDPPSIYSPTLLVSEENIILWQPIDYPAHNNSWLMVTATLQHINQWRLKTLAAGFAMYGLVCSVVLIIMGYTVHQSVKVVRDSARFADTITSNPNSELNLPRASEELNHLIDALNRISKHWGHRQQLSEQANTHLRLHKAVIDLHSAVFITNGSGRIEYVNQHFCIASGYEERELLGKSIGILNSGHHDDHYFKNLWRTLALGRVWQGALCNRNKVGEHYWVQCTIAPIKDHLDRPCQYIALQTRASVETLTQEVAAAK